LSLAKYPFLGEAGSYLREVGFNWEELDKPQMKDIIEQAVQRVEIGVSGGVYEKLEREYEIEVLTFLVSLLIVKSISIESVTKKYALAESRRAERFLTEDLKDKKDIKKLFNKIFYELFDLKIDVVEYRFFRISITDYLLRSSHFHEQEWKLINRITHKGYVYLDTDEIVRIIRNELSVIIRNKVKTMTLPELPESIKLEVEKLRTKFASAFETRTYTITEYPPCIKHAIEVMSKGENLPHSGRVMLATYMLAVGKSVDEIILLFQNAPDFNEKITRYQVEHLAGIKGGHTKYSVPSCEKIRNNNLCFATAECEGIFNPIKFGRKLIRNDSNRTE
jgi:DNA primase large subunit